MDVQTVDEFKGMLMTNRFSKTFFILIFFFFFLAHELNVFEPFFSGEESSFFGEEEATGIILSLIYRLLTNVCLSRLRQIKLLSISPDGYKTLWSQWMSSEK